MNRLNQEQLDFLEEDSRQEGDTDFGYRLLEIELETMFGFDLYTNEYEGRIQSKCSTEQDSGRRAGNRNATKTKT